MAKDKDPYELYSVKRRLDKRRRVLMGFSFLIDMAFLAINIYAVLIAINSHKKGSYCSLLDTQVYVFTMTAICFIRCMHLILMMLFLIFWVIILLPCLVCIPDNCCAKRFLIKRAKAPKLVLANLRA